MAARLVTVVVLVLVMMVPAAVTETLNELRPDLLPEDCGRRALDLGGSSTC